MLSTPYARDKTFKGQHTSDINCLAFSPHADYLASGSDDCKLAVWNVGTGTVACTIDTQNPVLSLTWDPRRRSTILFGCENGVAAVLSDFEDPRSAHPIMTGTKSAVYCLDIDPISGKLAIGVGPEVHLAVALMQDRYATVDIMPEPAQLRNNVDSSYDLPLLRPRSVHFLRGGMKLVVSYLNHGVVCWDVQTRTNLWQIEPAHSHRHIGFSALSPDQRFLLISNLSTGADLYRLGQSMVIQSYPQVPESTRNFPLAVAFLHKGEATICGATRGDVSIRQTLSGEHQQTLEHGGDLVQVLCVGQYQSTGFVATAALGLDREVYIRTWKAKLAPSIRNSYLNTAFASVTFFFYADVHEKSETLHSYGAIILPMLVIIGYYMWNMEGVMWFSQTASDAITSAAGAMWERVTDICLNFWAVFLDWLRERLRRWLFEGDIAQHLD